MQINTHLSFDGHCEEAFKFYEKALGGKIDTICHLRHIAHGQGHARLGK